MVVNSIVCLYAIALSFAKAWIAYRLSTKEGDVRCFYLRNVGFTQYKIWVGVGAWS